MRISGSRPWKGKYCSILCIFLALMALLFSSSCTESNDIENGVIEVCREFYEDIANKEYERAYELTHPSFKRVIEYETFEETAQSDSSDFYAYLSDFTLNAGSENLASVKMHYHKYYPEYDYTLDADYYQTLALGDGDWRILCNMLHFTNVESLPTPVINEDIQDAFEAFVYSIQNEDLDSAYDMTSSVFQAEVGREEFNDNIPEYILNFLTVDPTSAVILADEEGVALVFTGYTKFGINYHYLVKEEQSWKVEPYIEYYRPIEVMPVEINTTS